MYNQFNVVVTVTYCTPSNRSLRDSHFNAAMIFFRGPKGKPMDCRSLSRRCPSASMSISSSANVPAYLPSPMPLRNSPTDPTPRLPMKSLRIPPRPPRPPRTSRTILVRSRGPRGRSWSSDRRPGRRDHLVRLPRRIGPRAPAHRRRVESAGLCRPGNRRGRASTCHVSHRASSLSPS